MSVLAASAVMLLSGCGGLNPGVAAVVGDSTISHDEVDDVAMALCAVNITGAAAQGQEVPEVPTRVARESALQILIESELAHELGEERGVEPNRRLLSQAMAQREQAIALLPEDSRADFRDAFRAFTEGQLILIEAGRQSLEEQGQGVVTDQQAIAEGQRLLGEYVDTIEVEVDPRYGEFEDQRFKHGGTSLSVPVSDEARAGDSAQPDPTWVTGLPASQKCS